MNNQTGHFLVNEGSLETAQAALEEIGFSSIIDVENTAPGTDPDAEFGPMPDDPSGLLGAGDGGGGGVGE